MAKKPQGTDTNRHDIAAPPENGRLDKSIIQYIIRALLMMILFAWALMNLDAVMEFLRKVLSLFSPFLIGGGIAFLINVILNPLERCWNRVCKKAPAKMARPKNVPRRPLPAPMRKTKRRTPPRRSVKR